MENNVGHIVYQHQAALRKFLTGLCLFAIVQYKDPSNFSHILLNEISPLKFICKSISDQLFENSNICELCSVLFYFMIYSLTISAPVKQLIWFVILQHLVLLQTHQPFRRITILNYPLAKVKCYSGQELYAGLSTPKFLLSAKCVKNHYSTMSLIHSDYKLIS